MRLFDGIIVNAIVNYGVMYVPLDLLKKKDACPLRFVRTIPSKQWERYPAINVHMEHWIAPCCGRTVCRVRHQLVDLNCARHNCAHGQRNSQHAVGAASRIRNQLCTHRELMCNVAGIHKC